MVGPVPNHKKGMTMKKTSVLCGNCLLNDLAMIAKSSVFFLNAHLVVISEQNLQSYHMEQDLHLFLEHLKTQLVA